MIPPDASWLKRWSTRSPLDDLRRYANERATPARVTIAEQQWHAAQPVEPEPVITHHPVDDTLQTGDSRLLGGAMEIRSPWTDDRKAD